MALVSVKEAAKQLGIARSTLYSPARQHKIPHVKIGDRVLLNVAKLEEMLEIAAESANRPLVISTDARKKLQCKS